MKRALGIDLNRIWLLVFGIGTQTNNALGSATVLTVDANGNITAAGTAYATHGLHMIPFIERAVREILAAVGEDPDREGLRDEVSSGKPVAQVEAAFEAVYADMDKAEALLR